MKIGLRKPSLRKRLAARTSAKRFLRHSVGLKAPRGWGWVTNPRKAAYNRLYYRTTFGIGDLMTTRRSRRKSDSGFFVFLLAVVIFWRAAAIFSGLYRMLRFCVVGLVSLNEKRRAVKAQLATSQDVPRDVQPLPVETSTPAIPPPSTFHPIPDRSTSRHANQYADVTDSNRLAQIFRESGEMAVISKNPAIAHDRFDLALEAYYQLRSLPLAQNFRDSVQNAMVTLAEKFPSQVCINEALGLCEHAQKLKTVRSQLKYLYRARDALDRGLALNDGGQDGLRSIYDQVTRYIAQGETLQASQGK